MVCSRVKWDSCPGVSCPALTPSAVLESPSSSSSLSDASIQHGRGVSNGLSTNPDDDRLDTRDVSTRPSGRRAFARTRAGFQIRRAAGTRNSAGARAGPVALNAQPLREIRNRPVCEPEGSFDLRISRDSAANCPSPRVTFRSRACALLQLDCLRLAPGCYHVYTVLRRKGRPTPRRLPAR